MAGDQYDVTIRIGGKEELKNTLRQFDGEIVKVNVKSQNADKGVVEVKNRAERAWTEMQSKMSNLLHLQQKMDEISARVDLTVNQKELMLENLKLQALQTLSTITGMINTGWSMFKSTAELIGGGVDGLVESLVGFGLSAVSSLITIATGMMGNPWTAVLGAIALASAIITLINTLNTHQEMQQKKAELDAKLTKQLTQGARLTTTRISVML